MLNYCNAFPILPIYHSSNFEIAKVDALNLFALFCSIGFECTYIDLWFIFSIALFYSICSFNYVWRQKQRAKGKLSLLPLRVWKGDRDKFAITLFYNLDYQERLTTIAITWVGKGKMQWNKTKQRGKDFPIK